MLVRLPKRQGTGYANDLGMNSSQSRLLQAYLFFLDDLRRFMLQCLQKLEHNPQSFLERLTPDMRTRLRTLCRSYWEPYMQDLRHPFYQGNLIFRRPADACLRLGKALGLDDSTPIIERHEAALTPTPLEGHIDGVPRCHYASCLCSVYRPSHSLKICKGCHQVFYCNAQCQRRWVATLLRCLSHDSRAYTT